MNEPGDGGTDTDRETIREAAEALVEVRGELKAYLRMIDRPDPPITLEELQTTAGIRDLVGLHRELRKRDDGEPYNDLIVSNAGFAKRKKNDAADAEAIVDAARQPEMRFVEPKTPDQQARAILFRARERIVHQRMELVNALRAPFNFVLVPASDKNEASPTPD